MSNNQTCDLTQGRVSQTIWFLAGPMIATTLLQNALSVIDMFWVGKLGAVAVAAVAFAGTVLMMIMTMLIGIGAGTLAMVSRFVGAKNYNLASNAVVQSLALSVIISLILAITGVIFARPMLVAMRAGPDVVAAGTGYLKIMLLGSITTVLLFLISTMLQGAGNTYTPLVVMLVVCVINAVLDPILIFGWLGLPAWHIDGAALATVISQLAGVFISLGELFSGNSRIKLFLKDFFLDFPLMGKIIRIGLPASLQMGFRALMGVAVIWIVAWFGTIPVAAYGIGMRLQMTVLMPGFALGNAAAALVGQNLGANQPKRAKQAAWLACAYYMGIMFVCAVFFFIFARELVRLFNSDPAVVNIGAEYIRVTSFSYVFVALGVVLSRALNGAGDTVPPMLITLFSLWAVQIPLAVILSGYYNNINGVWWAITWASILNGILMLGWFLLGRWKHRTI